MVPMHAVILSLDSSIWMRAAPLELISQEFQCSAPSCASDHRPRKSEDDLVITPGGPRPRNKVHHVRPGEAVRQDKSGAYTIVPNDVPASPEPTNKKQNKK